MNKNYKQLLFLLISFHIFSGSASAITMNISAYNNSLANSPLNTGIALNTGDIFSVTVDPTDTWSAGPADRTSNANGLGPGNPYGGNYGLYTFGGFSFYYGSLIGRIDSGDYFLVGTNFNGPALNAGLLQLLYWDSNFADNSGSVAALISTNGNGPSPIPEPSTFLLLSIGLAGLGLVVRKTIKNRH